jgi:hypothetical protein
MSIIKINSTLSGLVVAYHFSLGYHLRLSFIKIRISQDCILRKSNNFTNYYKGKDEKDFFHRIDF